MKRDSLNRSLVEYLFREHGGWWRELFFFPLSVISWIYWVVVWFRATLYQRGFFKTRQLPCKVISVGNITLGGTGKTPLVATLARELRQRGLNVGILSRGYKGMREKTGGVLSDGTRIYLNPTEAGDEPFMLASMLSDVPVLVGKKRYAMGIQAQQKFGIDVLILDDGFQHLRIKREVDIVLVDSRHGFGNGRLFPRGPLREPLRCLRRASMLLLTKSEPSQSFDELEGVLRFHAPAILHYHSRYKPVSFLETASGKRFPPQFVQGKRVLAFAGIADPGYFVYLLKDLGADIEQEIHFPDHYNYTLKDVIMMREHKDNVDLFITTEKDFVKLQRHPVDDLPLCVLIIEQEILEESFYPKIFSNLSLML